MTTPVSTTITLEITLTVEGVIHDGRPAMDLPQEVDELDITEAWVNRVNLFGDRDPFSASYNARLADSLITAVGEGELNDALWREFSATAP